MCLLTIKTLVLAYRERLSPVKNVGCHELHLSQRQSIRYLILKMHIPLSGLQYLPMLLIMNSLSRSKVVESAYAEYFFLSRILYSVLIIIYCTLVQLYVYSVVLLCNVLFLCSIVSLVLHCLCTVPSQLCL